LSRQKVNGGNMLEVKKKRKKYQYKPETIIKRRIKMAKFMTDCMVRQADKTGSCVVLAKQRYCATLENGKRLIVHPGETDTLPVEMALDAEKNKVCEILYNPFTPSVAGIPSEEKIYNYYMQRFKDYPSEGGEPPLIPRKE